MRKYIRMLKMELSLAREYLLYYFSSLLTLPVMLILYYFLFKALFPNELTSELMMYYTVILLMKTAMGHSMAEIYYVFTDISEGNLDLALSKPYNYPLMRFFRALGSVLPTMLISFLILFVFFASKVEVVNFILFIILSFLGFGFFFIFMFLVGELTFFIKNVLTLRDILWLFVSLLSFEIIPAEILPASLNFLKFNPFYSLYVLPYQALMGRDIKIYIAVSAIYLILSLILTYSIWKRGVNLYESQGG